MNVKGANGTPTVVGCLSRNHETIISDSPCSSPPVTAPQRYSTRAVDAFRLPCFPHSRFFPTVGDGVRDHLKPDHALSLEVVCLVVFDDERQVVVQEVVPALLVPNWEAMSRRLPSVMGTKREFLQFGLMPSAMKQPSQLNDGTQVEAPKTKLSQTAGRALASTFLHHTQALSAPARKD